ncbi:hypothetical protein [Mucilaginibacter polytrichastri]|uniref:Uncharacterized protein n=1 Tax=Mucilaginibacter polytrichastri TaxID=1302689 RepID=A0A1Q5ZZM8_9SPHI|nr:hypothetical protein [Mucilaginibacter polytrichastri]OKS87201.1 hypothetical protein RG47T_2660 [Mucilaginibacter polytrichastri]SFT19168.1 hypothetical protein SAMN04487890_11599 [Mucilaginibacter polytrichastri]
MKITEEQTGQSPLSFATNNTFNNDKFLTSTDPDENETGIEDEDDLHEIRVGDDVKEPDPEKDYSQNEPYEDDDQDPVPSPS